MMTAYGTGASLARGAKEISTPSRRKFSSTIRVRSSNPSNPANAQCAPSLAAATSAVPVSPPHCRSQFKTRVLVSATGNLPRTYRRSSTDTQPRPRISNDLLMNREWTIRPQTNREWTRIRNANGRESNHKDEPQTNADERHINPQITQNLSRPKLCGGGLDTNSIFAMVGSLGNLNLFIGFTFFLSVRLAPKQSRCSA